MSRIVLFESIFNNEYKEINVCENKAICDILYNINLENSIIFVDGNKVESNYILKDDETCTIRLIPEGNAGNAQWSGIDIFLSVLTGGAYAVANLIYSAFTGETFVQSAIKYSMSGLLSTNSDGSSKTQEEVESIPQIRGAKNQSASGKPYPIVFGKHLFTPYYIGSPYTEIDGEDGENQYYTVLLLLGYSKLRVTDICIGNSIVSENPDGIENGFLPIYDLFPYKDSDPQIEIQQGANEVSLYPQKVVEEQLAIALLRADDKANVVTRFSAKNPMKVQVEIGMNALLSYDESGNKKDATVEIGVYWRLSGQSTWNNFNKFEGCNKYADGVSTFTRQKAKNMRFVAEKPFSYSEIIDDNDPTGGQRIIEIKIERKTNQSTDGRTSDAVYLTAIRTWCFDYTASKEKGTLVKQIPMIEKDRDRTCRMGFRIKAGSELQGTIDSINCIVESYCRTWDGSSWSTEETPSNNPASCALKILQSPSLGKKAYSDSKIDLQAFGKLYKFCEENSFTCNGVLTKETKLEDLMASILSTCRSFLTVDGKYFSVFTDNERSNFVLILNNQNIIGTPTNSKSFDELPDGLCVKFIDEYDGYQENTIYVKYDGTSDVKADETFEDVSMPYVTNRNQIYKNGYFELAKKALRPETWSRKVSVDGNLLYIGALVQIQDDTIVVGIGDGAEIKEIATSSDGNYINGIITDGFFNVSDLTKRYGIKITQSDGINPISIRTVEVTIEKIGVYDYFVFTNPISITDTVIPSIGDIVSFGEYDKIVTEAIILGKQDNGDGTFDLTLVPYNEEVYNFDGGGIPVFDSKINEPQKPAGIHELPPDYVTKDDLYNGINGAMGGSAATEPETPTDITAVAYEEYIDIDCTPKQGGISNIIEYYKYEIYKNGVWKSYVSYTKEFKYYYDRKTDGYPEKSDFADWKVRVKVVNAYGLESEYSLENIVSTDQYKTWLINPVTASAIADKEGITFTHSEVSEEVYGNIVYDIVIKGKIVSTAQSLSDRYLFNRDTDGYPEKSDLLSWDIKVSARNEAGNTDTQITEDNFDLTNYKTWIVQSVEAVATPQEDEIVITYPQQSEEIYGTIRYEISVNGRIDGNTSLQSYRYKFNRSVDGYPEKEDFDTYDIKVRIFNEATQAQAVVTIDTSVYKTWIPTVTNVSAKAQEDFIIVSWETNAADCYGFVRADIFENDNVIRKNLSQSPLYRYFDRKIDGYPNKEDLTQEFKVEVKNEAHTVVSESVLVDVSDYGTWDIVKPQIKAVADETVINISWIAGDNYGTPVYSVIVDGITVVSRIKDNQYSYVFNPEEKGYPEGTDIQSWNIVLKVETQADTAEFTVDTVDISGYKGYTPKTKPVLLCNTNGRIITLSWKKDFSVYGYTGARVQVAKAYKIVDGKYTPVTEESELVWYEPALGLNPYQSYDNYKTGEEGGYLSVNGETITFAVPLYGQENSLIEPETMYAYRIATETHKTCSVYSLVNYQIAKPVTANDVVKAWDIKDTGEKVKIDGALGAAQIFVKELAAITANLGFITDGMITGSEYNYWAVSDVIDDETGEILRYRGEWRVGGEDQYILVKPKMDETGQVIQGQYDIKFNVGEYVVIAGETVIKNESFTVLDKEGNILFQVTPQQTNISVIEGRYISKETQKVKTDLFNNFVKDEKSNEVFSVNGNNYFLAGYVDEYGIDKYAWHKEVKGVIQRVETIDTFIVSSQRINEYRENNHLLFFEAGYFIGDLPKNVYGFSFINGKSYSIIKNIISKTTAFIEFDFKNKISRLISVCDDETFDFSQGFVSTKSGVLVKSASIDGEKYLGQYNIETGVLVKKLQGAYDLFLYAGNDYVCLYRSSKSDYNYELLNVITSIKITLDITLGDIPFYVKNESVFFCVNKDDKKLYFYKNGERTEVSGIVFTNVNNIKSYQTIKREETDKVWYLFTGNVNEKGLFTLDLETGELKNIIKKYNDCIVNETNIFQIESEGIVIYSKINPELKITLNTEVEFSIEILGSIPIVFGFTDNSCYCCFLYGDVTTRAEIVITETESEINYSIIDNTMPSNIFDIYKQMTCLVDIDFENETLTKIFSEKWLENETFFGYIGGNCLSVEKGDVTYFIGRSESLSTQSNSVYDLFRFTDDKTDLIQIGTFSLEGISSSDITNEKKKFCYCACDDDYIYLYVLSVYGGLLYRISTTTATVDITGLPSGRKSDVKLLSVFNNKSVIKVTDTDIFIADVCALQTDTGSETFFTEDTPVLMRLKKDSIPWNEIITGTYAKPDVWQVQVNGKEKLFFHAFYNTDNFLLLNSNTTGENPYANILEFSIGEETEIQSYPRFVFKGNVKSNVFYDIDEIDLVTYIAYSSADKSLVPSLQTVLPSIYSLDGKILAQLVKKSEEEYKIDDGKKVYQTGIGFTGIYFDEQSKRYRYYLDTGAFIEFDENRNIVSEGEKGDKGDKGDEGKRGDDGLPGFNVEGFIGFEVRDGHLILNYASGTVPRFRIDSNGHLVYDV